MCNFLFIAFISAAVRSPFATVMTRRFSSDLMPSSSRMLCTAVPRPCSVTVSGSASSSQSTESAGSASGFTIAMT